MSDAPDLGANEADALAMIVRSVTAAIPVYGGVIAEVITLRIPNQKAERLANFVALLNAELSSLRVRVNLIEERFRTAEGSDLLEEALRQVTRAVTPERRARIARLFARGLSEEELRYDRIKKLLSLVESLTDSEFIVLDYYADEHAIGGEVMREKLERHREMLLPVWGEIDDPQDLEDKRSMRDAFEHKLMSEGLIGEAKSRTPRKTATALGRMLLRYTEEAGPTEAAGPGT